VPDEEWRPIPEWDGYEASSQGRIRSWRSTVPGKRANKPKVMATPIIRGHPTVGLCINGHRVGRQVGAWVLDAFVGPRPEGMECSHRNGNALDNSLGNLVWETHAENMARKLGHGTIPRGSAHASAKLTDRDVQLIRRMLEVGIPQSMTAWVFETSRTAISDIHTGRSWKAATWKP
jgi:hypothetical protein